MIFLEIGSTDMFGIFAIIFGIMFGPPLILLLIGLSRRKTNPDTAKKFYIAAVVYLIVSGGICASLMN